MTSQVTNIKKKIEIYNLNYNWNQSKSLEELKIFTGLAAQANDFVSAPIPSVDFFSGNFITLK